MRRSVWIFVAAVAVLAAHPAGAAAGIEFAPAANYPTGSTIGPGPGAVTTEAGDLDGDGDVDVVITDWFGSAPIVMHNDGTGAFGSPTRLPAGSGVLALAVGDLDADGRLDIVGRAGAEVIVWLGRPGGTFQVADREPGFQGAQPAVAVFDANLDDQLDVATTTPAGVQVLLGHGDGTVTAGPTTPALGLLSDLTPANFDGDGIPDLALVDATPLLQRIVSLRGNGDGSFTVAGSGAVGYGPEGVMAGDLDGDGIDDAVSVDSFSALNTLSSFFITVLLSDGAGGFEPPVHYPTASGPVSGALADFDGDGDLDVAVSGVGDGRVAVYANDGGGQLTDAGRLPVTSFPQTPAAADYDGDARVDLAVPGASALSVLRNIS
ncbi:MAG: FG-GAP repeat domain-containing protein [Acidimicrobiales bacterium]